MASAWADSSNAAITRPKRRAFYPPYENLMRIYVPGKPLLGPGSPFDDALMDRQHQPYRASHSLAVSTKLLADIDKHCDDETDRLIDDLIVIYPGKKGASGVSRSFVSSVKEGLRVYPLELIALLRKSGCQVHLAPMISDAEPQLADRHPAGYADDETYDSAGGVFARGRWIVIAEHRYWHEKLVPTFDFKRAAQHETAHALDRFLGEPSCSTEFAAAYEADRRAMCTAMRQAYAYYMQEGERGLKEVFAEMLASRYGDPAGNRWMHMTQVFPHCYGLMDQICPSNTTALVEPPLQQSAAPSSQ